MLNLQRQGRRRHKAGMHPWLTPHARPYLEALEDRTLPAWTAVAGISTFRTGLAAALAPDGRILALGGTAVSQKPLTPLTSVQAYSISANAWTNIAPLPQANIGLAAATGPDGRIYALGGSNLGGLTNVVQVFSPAAGFWTFAANMPTFRSDLAAATGPDGRIYAMGGLAASNQTNIVEAFDPAANRWTAVALMPTARSGLAAVTGTDGRIYAIGGQDFSGQAVATVEAYKPATNTWVTLANMPTPRFGLAAALGPDGRIYAIGGATTTGFPLNTVEAYTPASNSWTTVDNLPTPRKALAAVTGSDGRIYAIGGSTAAGPVATVEAFTVVPPNSGNTAFVAQVYLDLLHRPADAAGAAGYINLLNQGALSRTQVALIIEASVEYRTEQINLIYESLLHRAVDSGGLNALLGFLAAGGTYQQIQEIVASSNEFFADAGGTNDGFLSALYQDALGRSPDAAGKAGWNQLLSQGGTRAQVAVGFFASLEYDIDLVNSWYLTFLHRPADPGGLAGFVSALLHGVREEGLVATFVGSEEYFSRF
jgi:hypothetical protein